MLSKSFEDVALTYMNGVPFTKQQNTSVVYTFIYMYLL